jgi:tagaturonate reductase
METLTRQLLLEKMIPPSVKAGPMDPYPVRVVQMGEGNFLRAFTTWMVNELNRTCSFAGSIAVIQPRSGGKVLELRAQDCLYTLISRGISKGMRIDEKEIITSICCAIDPYREWDSYCALARRAEVRFFTSNTTEAGIVYAAEERPEGKAPSSFPAKVCWFLYERFLCFKGDQSRGLVFLPCELIERNGEQLRDAVFRHAADWKLGENFTEWILSSNRFINTLVDRIVPGYPKEEATDIGNELCYRDAYIDVTESYHIWILEGDGSLESELPLHRAGINAVWTDNLPLYRTRKVRILNGLHTMTVLASYLSGHETVRDSVEDAVIGRFMKKGVEEILLTIDMAAKEKERFAEEVFERFSNPFIKHYCLSIALNSVSKFCVRVLPSFLDYQAAYKTLPSALAFSLAALISFYRITGEANGSFTGTRGDKSYPVKDDDAVCRIFKDLWNLFSENCDYDMLASSVLSRCELWGRDLSRIEGLSSFIAASLRAIDEKGMEKAVDAVCEGACHD